jgi:hypothetical protein
MISPYRFLNRKSLHFLIFIILSYCPLYGQTYTEILGRPTNTSITISILSDQQMEVYWEYDDAPESFARASPRITLTKDVPYEFNFTGLQPGTGYFYRTRYRSSGSTGLFSIGPVHSFHTQRAEGDAFTFTIESDEHLYDKKGIRSLYQICLANQAADQPDFMLSLGDIFGDDHYPNTITSEQMKKLHEDYRPYLGQICHSVPLFLCLGNHEGESDYYLAQNPPENIAAYATLWRKFYYPNPYPDSFYTGNTDEEAYGMGNPENYYCWTWGDALFVVLDVYRDQCDFSAKPTNWDWSLGFPQYTWLKNTLENSQATYKFVFAHHIRGQGRGGITNARLYEWGGYEQNGSYTFPENRPGWAKPIHQLFVDNGVNIFFQGHDHVFAHEILDGVTYQSLPMPSDSTYEIGMLANAGAYVSDTVSGSGHLRVQVSSDCIKVDFIRAYLPADTVSGLHHNRETAFSYTAGNCQSAGLNDLPSSLPALLYPNPATDQLFVQTTDSGIVPQLRLISLTGQTLLEARSSQLDVSAIRNGIYVMNIKTPGREINQKLIISR